MVRPCLRTDYLPPIGQGHCSESAVPHRRGSNTYVGLLIAIAVSGIVPRSRFSLDSLAQRQLRFDYYNIQSS